MVSVPYHDIFGLSISHSEIVAYHLDGPKEWGRTKKSRPEWIFVISITLGGSKNTEVILDRVQLVDNYGCES